MCLYLYVSYIFLCEFVTYNKKLLSLLLLLIMWKWNKRPTSFLLQWLCPCFLLSFLQIPVLVTWLQCSIGNLLLSGMCGICSFEITDVWCWNVDVNDSRIPLKTYLLLAALTVGTMGLSNSSLGYLNYPTQVMFKCCKLIPVLIGGILIQGLYLLLYRIS